MKRYIKLFFILSVIAILFFWFLNNVNFKEVFRIISSVNVIYPVIFVLGVYSQYYIRAFRWRMILHPHKKGISILSLYCYTSIGFLLSAIIPGKVGEPAKGILMAREEHINPSYGLASVVLERLIDTLMMFVLLLLSFFVIPTDSNPLLQKLKTIALFIFPLLIGLFFLFYYLNSEKAFARVERFIRFACKIIPARARDKAISFSLHFVKGLKLDLPLSGYLKLLVTSFIVWLYLIPFYWILMKGFDFGGRIGFTETIPYFCTIVASAAIPSPGMAGSFDAVSRHALEGLYRVDTNHAAAYTILTHFLILIVMTIPGMISFWIKGLHFKTIRNLKGEPGDERNNKE
ncbi:MAG: lysylphosphatidylglycerol synthase transmembrane domain-containing protein [Candidatus Omnitrophota bacterium]